MTMNHDQKHRETIHLEDAEVLGQDAHLADQHVLRVHAPQCARLAQPGQFAHLQCDPLLPMRRPLSIMRCSASDGWVDFLYKAVGEGTRLLTRLGRGDRVSLLGPIGRPFQPSSERRRTLLIGGGVGMPPMIFLAEALRQRQKADGFEPFVILGSEVPFPFKARPSQMLVAGIPQGTIASMPLLEDWQIPSRLASQQEYPGCFEGYVTDLARHWLEALDEAKRFQVEIFACGPHPMLEAVAALAAEFRLPCQVSLEEFMACGVGGCAGCVVELRTAEGPAMRRVCVDGPVFDAREVFG